MINRPKRLSKPARRALRARGYRYNRYDRKWTQLKRFTDQLALGHCDVAKFRRKALEDYRRSQVFKRPAGKLPRVKHGRLPAHCGVRLDVDLVDYRRCYSLR